MSGTSLDGIDVAIVNITGKGWNKRVETMAQATEPYPRAVRQALLEISNADTHTSRIAFLHFLLPELYAKAVKTLCANQKIRFKSIELAGCHGQTVFHAGTPVRFLGKRIASTLQIGDGSVLAERLGVPVVSDFRPRDVAAGGQGAPLVPYVDYLLFRNPRTGRVALNIGGIANVTAIPAGAPPSKVFAFDTGPGNMVIDSLVSRFTNRARRYDEGGKLAARGKVSASLLRLLLRDRYYRKPPPKSTGREDYGGEFIEHLIHTRLPLEDIVATATAFTAATIGIGIRDIVMKRMKVQEVVVSGGGAHNRTLLDLLSRELPDLKIRPSSDFGIDVDAKEAVAFAVLAHETWFGRPSNLPAATGARAPVVLGKISPGPPKGSRKLQTRRAALDTNGSPDRGA